MPSGHIAYQPAFSMT